MARVIGAASVHDSRSGQEWLIDADDAIKGESAPAAVVAIRRRGGGNRSLEEYIGVISSLQ